MEKILLELGIGRYDLLRDNKPSIALEIQTATQASLLARQYHTRVLSKIPSQYLQRLWAIPSRSFSISRVPPWLMTLRPTVWRAPWIQKSAFCTRNLWSCTQPHRRKPCQLCPKQFPASSLAVFGLHSLVDSWQRSCRCWRQPSAGVWRACPSFGSWYWHLLLPELWHKRSC